MTSKIALTFAILCLITTISPGPAAAAGDSVSAKQFPVSYFFRYQKAPMAEKAKVLAQLDATLRQLNRENLGLIAKGAVIDHLDPNQRVYERLTILDESGLIITARRVPNLYYGYSGPGPMNPNVYIVIKQARVNVPESYIRYGFVVEGDFVAYADKFVTAIMENLEGAAGQGEERQKQ
jgi:hypothetical protein